VGDSIQRTNLDGSGVGNLVIGLNFPMGIALIVPPATVPEPSSEFLTIFGLLAAGDEPSIRRDPVSRLAIVYSL
jgi:hypothetical protein